MTARRAERPPFSFLNITMTHRHSGVADRQQGRPGVHENGDIQYGNNKTHR